MITVAGEALIDLVVEGDGHVTAALGGAPFNTARACGRLGADVVFVGALSDDRFGVMLREQLVADGVDVTHAAVVTCPTTLAMAELDARGAATYRFYVDGTSAPALSSVPPIAVGDVLFTGGLALVLEPLASAVESAVMSAPDGVHVVIDVNCRPALVADRSAFVARVRRLLGRAHLVKVSDEDLAFLDPGRGTVAAARGLLELGPRAVVVTAGGAGVDVLTAGDARFVPVAPVEVVDTIGAGDTFAGALVTWLTGHGHGVDAAGDPDLLGRAVRAASTAAGVACSRRGADPPYRHELPPGWAG